MAASCVATSRIVGDHIYKKRCLCRLKQRSTCTEDKKSLLPMKWSSSRCEFLSNNLLFGGQL